LAPPAYLSAIGLTIAIEGVAWRLLLRRRGPEIFLAAAGINLMTVPLANVFYWFAGPPLGFTTAWIAVELTVVLVETPLVRVLLADSWGRSARLALLANAASAACGLAIFGL
jgi:hypothetical protein